MKPNWDHSEINDNSIATLVATSLRKTYIIVATKGTLALIGQSEEFKRNLEKHQDRNRILETHFADRRQATSTLARFLPKESSFQNLEGEEVTW
jgi:hypothetical protein